jgi:putative two-component system response regulator
LILRQSVTPITPASERHASLNAGVAGSMTVLIVDDSSVNLKVYEKLVKGLGCSDPQTFSTSASALAWVSDHEVDLIVVDYKMAAPDGLKFIELIRQMVDKEHVPILMVTADQAKEVRRRALEAGANDFLAKPIDPDEFAARLKNMLALRQSQKQLAETASWLADQVKAATAELVAREREAILTLSMAAERRDPETGAHLKRIAHYCEAIARAAGLPRPQQELLLATAPLHDIGKIGIPDHILLKTGKLSPAEFATMRRHTLIGYDILRLGRSSTMKMAAQIALTHHERFDGSGYPHGLHGTQIPVVGAICGISDVFDALTSARSYKESLPMKDAVAEINDGAGTLFDPELIGAFNAILPEIAEIKRTYPEERT